MLGVVRRSGKVGEVGGRGGGWGSPVDEQEGLKECWERFLIPSN
jgi:hypothetical protein